ncbi:MAG: Uma2 family endonuclease [Bacteroidales bacterium]|nr:Uma2 family endonuclease [Bacteroidales bacterium]MCM1414854.1 Uma2 family endonuclease [bacterium]MCM1422486.1 Uma2 family endonuclease [bacterium]
MEVRSNREEQFMVIEGGKKVYTVADIEALPPGERAELIDGEMFIMEAPSITHQRILGELYVQVHTHIKNKKGSCEAFISPAVYVKDDIHNYVEPDITVVCKEEQLDEKGCHGAPDWVIEIASPSNKYMDYGRKLMLYQSAGIREYWIVDPTKKIVTIYDFEHGDGPDIHPFTKPIKVGIYEDLYLDLGAFL